MENLKQLYSSAINNSTLLHQEKHVLMRLRITMCKTSRFDDQFQNVIPIDPEGFQHWFLGMSYKHQSTFSRIKCIFIWMLQQWERDVLEWVCITVRETFRFDDPFQISIHVNTKGFWCWFMYMSYYSRSSFFRINPLVVWILLHREKNVLMRLRITVRGTFRFDGQLQNLIPIDPEGV